MMKFHDPLLATSRKHFRKALGYVELAGLIVIAVITALAMLQQIEDMLSIDKIHLTDLLLMFLYLEVFAMVAQYLKWGQLPVRFPLQIAMVSIARDLIVRAAVNTETHLLASTGAIVLLAIGVLLIQYYPKHFTHQHHAHPPLDEPD